MRCKLALASLLGITTLAGASAAYAAFTPGSSGLGDPFFPLGGNGGYDVRHYGLTLAYDPPSNQLTGTAEIDATATQNLSQFDLDFRGFTITRLEVERRRRRVHTGWPRARHHARPGLPAGAAVHGHRRLPGHADAWSPTPTGRSRVGCRPTTVRSASASRRARRAGSRATTTRRTRRRSTSRSPSRRASRRWPMACWCRTRRAAARRHGCGTRPTRWRPISPPPTSAAST